MLNYSSRRLSFKRTVVHGKCNKTHSSLDRIQIDNDLFTVKRDEETYVPTFRNLNLRWYLVNERIETTELNKRGSRTTGNADATN